MTSVPYQANQAFYIQQYLAGQPSVKPSPPTSAQWVNDLIDSLDPEDVDSLLEDLKLSSAWNFRRPTLQTQAAQDEEKQKGNQRNFWRTISNVIFYTALMAIVFGAVIFGSKSGGRTQFFGFSYFEVLSGSMESVIPKGSLVLVKKVPSADIKVGDAITFLRSDEETVTHEVIEIAPNFDDRGTLGFRTKGTDNLDADPDIVAAPNVLGVVKLHIKTMGFTLRWISENIEYAFILFVLVILASIALRVLLGERKRQKPQVQQPDQQTADHIIYRVKQPKKGRVFL